MDEIINFLIELFYACKYGELLNRSKDFSQELESSIILAEPQSTELKKEVQKQIALLTKEMIGTPTFVLFKAHTKGWYKVFVINEKKKFCCRLKDWKLEEYIDVSTAVIRLN